MSIRLTDSERSRLRGMARRPRSRKQLYRAEALLALDEGQPVEAVARKFRVGVDRVESWIEGFQGAGSPSWTSPRPAGPGPAGRSRRSRDRIPRAEPGRPFQAALRPESARPARMTAQPASMSATPEARNSPSQSG